jgi:hypothetical protein
VEPVSLRAVPSSPTPPGRWTWESARGNERAVRVTPHADARLVSVSVWRDDRCVASVHLTPAEAAALTGKLTGALAEIAARPVAEPDPGADLAARVAELEGRLAALERPATA